MRPGWKKVRFVVITFWAMVCLQGCMDDDSLWQTQPPDIAVSGVFVINEGNFMYGNASLSFYDPAERRVVNDVFFNTNGLPLGDVALSMTQHNGLGYIVINNSGRIYVVDLENFQLRGKITGLTSPRYMHVLSDEKAYVSDLYAKAIAIVNPTTFEVTGSIEVNNPGSVFYQHPTEQMIQVGKYLYTNCWSFDHTLLVIDTETDQWIETIEVLKQPQSMVLDRFDKLWVLTDGGFAGSPYGHEAPGLLRIDAHSREIEQVFRFGLHDHPRSLSINGTGDTLYFINRHVYRHPVISEALPQPVIESPYPANAAAGYRALGIDPVSSEIYVGDAIDMVQPGIVYRFSPQTTPIDTFRVGIIPGSFAFREVMP